MTYITTTLVIIVTLIVLTSTQSNLYFDYNYNNPEIKTHTRKISIKQGDIQGIIMEPKINAKLPLVEQYRGIPYAAPPVGSMRFMPPGSALPWDGLRIADTFSAVCPQKFPKTVGMAPERKNYFLMLKQYLQYESEDCLYLNIYTPHQDNVKNRRKYPVMVYIHGESFEWNSGNPYDGSVLAAYGKVIVVTLNFRLGVLGFLKTGVEQHSKCNFGLIDQIAALLWIKENIAAFDGDPDSVTLFGHGTGAVCASLLTLTPMSLKDGNDQLFHRVILMGGSALSDWALTHSPREITYQVSKSLNCPVDDDFASCLRRKSLNELKDAMPPTSKFRTRFGPVIDGLVVPSSPKKLMTIYNNIFKKFDLMYGVTEMESINLLGAVALTHGMLENERDADLREYMHFRCEIKPELCVTHSLNEYTTADYELDDRQLTGREPDRASQARNILLDILSDARTVAPMVQMGEYRASLNLSSYFYVFTHKTSTRNYIRNKSFNGEELPYVFGVPLDGNRYHFIDQYTDKERLFSEKVMTYFSNFAYTGDPNIPRKNYYYTLEFMQWMQYNVQWPVYDLTYEKYLQLGVPPYVLSHYRHNHMRFWNQVFPSISHASAALENIINHNNLTKEETFKKERNEKPKSMPPWLVYPPSKGTSAETYFPKDHSIKFKFPGPSSVDYVIDNDISTIIPNTSQSKVEKSSATMNILITIGAVFLLTNLLLFIGLYYKCYRVKKNQNSNRQEVLEATIIPGKAEKLDEETFINNGCNLMKIINKSNKSDDTYEAVKISGSRSSGKRKLARQMSTSTIDAQTKVRAWITQEIVNKYSPRYLRRPRQQEKIVTPKIEFIDLEREDNSTLGRTPTRPASPNENFKKMRPPLLKSSSIPTPKMHKKPAKISVAVDATPNGRGSSVMKQQPIELTKSLDIPNFASEKPLRRSATMEDFSIQKLEDKPDLRRSSTSINLKLPFVKEPALIKIEHFHSKSEPVQDLYSNRTKKLKTFDPTIDVNVTSCDESPKPAPLTPEEALMTIKRRNFPKVLPDYPARETLMNKRRSMPVPGFFSIPEAPQLPSKKFFGKLPPTPPPRTTSSLTRKTSSPSKICQSEPMLAEEPPSQPEPEITYNNLYFGPLLPKLKSESSSCDSLKISQQHIYEGLQSVKTNSTKNVTAKTIITTNPVQPIRKVDPKIIIKPTGVKTVTDPKHRNIPRVMADDNLPSIQKGNDQDMKNVKSKLSKQSHIPTPIRKELSSSESSPSEGSDTGTVVKRI